MKVIIPVKSESSRVKNKNFRQFYEDKCLTEILIEKLVKVIPSNEIYLSCDDYGKKEICDRYEINFLLRDSSLVKNEVPMSEVITKVVEQIQGDDEIMWCLVTDPLFSNYAEVLQKWDVIKDRHDSLVVVYPLKEYILDSSYKPIEFGFGKDHIPTQYLLPKYRLNNTLFIIKRDSLFENQYYIGQSPYWFHANNVSVDIDTEQEFELAKLIFSFYEDKKNEKCNYNLFTVKN